MTTDNDTTFGPVVTTPSSFGVVFQHDKDMPALHCVDLFPNPPRQLDDVSQDIPDNVSTGNIADLHSTSNENSVASLINEDNLEDNLIISNDTKMLLKTLTDVDKSPVIGNPIENHPPQNESCEKIELASGATMPSPDCITIEAGKTPNRLQFPLPVVSPALSISSHHSSAESVSSATSSSKKKKKKRICVTCGLHFSHKAELLEHLKLHVGQPTIHLENLTDDNVHLQEFRERQHSLTSGEEDLTENLPHAKVNPPQHNESGGLKLKLKMSGSQNFQVVPINRLTEKCAPPVKKHTERVITAQETKQSISSRPNAASNNGPLDAMVALTEIQSTKQLESDENLLASKYFECPTLDGLDQFAEEINNEVAEDLLKKLLEGGQQMPQENDWGCNTNEFISIDRLAYMCPICSANFPDAMRLYDHKRITGHDFQHPMHPPPPPSNMPHMDMMAQYRLRQPFQPHLPTSIANSVNMHPNCRPGENMRPNFQMYPQPQPRFAGSPPFNQAPQARRPPPLYRVPAPQNPRPVNMAPFAEMNPEMYIPSSNNGHAMMNGNFQPNQPHLDRQAIFLKARLQRPAQRPRTPGMYERSPNGTPSPPVVLSQQTITRPRFLGPMPAPLPGPPAKKIKHESSNDDCEIVSTQPRTDGIPVIQSVQGGATVPQPFSNERSKDPILLNDQITLSLKNKDQNKNPKEVASILANRGITVTHKPKPPGGMPPRESSPKNNAQEAVQKLQLNNSVSIISKKRTFESTEEPARPRSGDSAFILCPIADCEEKFLTQEGLNRHTQRGHKLAGKIGLKAFKCKLCPAMFSTQEGLMEHQRKNHRMMKTSADEVGIPIVDLRNEETKRKLAQLGIVNYIPLNAKTSNGCFGFPIVSVQGAANPNICNMQGMGVNSILSLGPIKQIPLRKMD